MKTKKIDKKLTLRKTTLVNLGTNDQRNIHGGISDTDCMGCETAWAGANCQTKGCTAACATRAAVLCDTDYADCMVQIPEP
jgi:hypothetical protein